MHNGPDLGHLAEYPPQVVLQILLANNLTSFTEFAFGVVRPGTPFKPNWHLEAVTHKLAQVANGEVRRLIITLPPRSLKSLCASVALPAWFLGRHPSERVMSSPTRTCWRAPMPMTFAFWSAIRSIRRASRPCVWRVIPTARS